MVFSKKITFMACIAILLGGCAASPRLQGNPPQGQDVSAYALGVPARLDEVSPLPQYLDGEKSILYSPRFGGAASLGGMLGAGHIVEQLRGKLDMKPREIFPEVARHQKLNLATEKSANTWVTPYLQVASTEEGKLVVAAALIVEREQDGQKWAGKYLYQLPGQYSLESLAALDTLGMYTLYGRSVEGFAKLVRHLSTASAVAPDQEVAISFTSALVRPRFADETPGSLIADENDVVWIRAADGVYALRKANLSYQAASQDGVPAAQ